jgi:hypothetical protein
VADQVIQLDRAKGKVEWAIQMFGTRRVGFDLFLISPDGSKTHQSGDNIDESSQVLTVGEPADLADHRLRWLIIVEGGASVFNVKVQLTQEGEPVPGGSFSYTGSQQDSVAKVKTVSLGVS